MDILNLLPAAVVIVAVLAIATLWVIAPLMLYAIYTRIGETNELLRYIAARQSDHTAEKT